MFETTGSPKLLEKLMKKHPNLHKALTKSFIGFSETDSQMSLSVRAITSIS